MKLSKMIDEKKFKKDMKDYLGFNDKAGTHIFEQWGDSSLRKIKTGIISDILFILDDCRKAQKNEK